jgi:hypothetical protein
MYLSQGTNGGGGGGLPGGSPGANGCPLGSTLSWCRKSSTTEAQAAQAIGHALADVLNAVFAPVLDSIASCVTHPTVLNCVVAAGNIILLIGTSFAAPEDEAAELKAYGGPGGGHHVPAKSAFVGEPAYDLNKALAIPNAELKRLGVSHSAITGAQMTGYRAFAATGQTLTWSDVARIETNALERGGMSAGMARATVNKGIQALKDAGVSGPTRIPWGG